MPAHVGKPSNEVYPDELSMCNRARQSHEPETLHTNFATLWGVDPPVDNRFNPRELTPSSRAYVVREDDRGRGLDIMSWDLLGGGAKWPMTNVRNLALPQWQRLASKPENRCLIPLTEFCEWTPDKDPTHGIKGEMWFAVTDEPIFAVAGFWQPTAKGNGFTMVTCEPNELVAPIHPKAMVTILHAADFARWLQGDLADVVALQRPYPADQMTVRGPVFPTRQS